MKTGYFDCSPEVKAEILEALRQQEIDRVAERLVNFTLGSLDETQPGETHAHH